MSTSTDIRSHFSFTATPFTREFPINQRFEHPQFDEQLTAMHQTVVDRMSGALITPAGTGKTVLLRALCDMLPEARYRISYIKVPDLSKRDMCREIARAIGCQEAGQYNTLVHRIQVNLESTYQCDGVRPVILIDNAHKMRLDVLSLLEILTNFEMDSRLVVSFFLCGQKRLQSMLARDEMEAVSRRLAHVGTLRNLSREETKRYVLHRLTMAGGKEDPFTQGAHDAIFEIAHGNMRAIDRICLKSLQLAADDGSSGVDNAHVAKARERLWV